MAFDFSSLTSQEKVTATYLAYYGRAADPAGRDFWAEQLAGSDGDLSAIIDAFGTSQEAVQRFGTLSNEAAVQTLFQSLFGRAPDLAGLEFYVGELEAGRLSLQTIALDVLNGASDTDAAIVENRIAAGQAYTDALVDAAADATAAEARAVVAGVDATSSSVKNAEAAAAAITGEGGSSVVSGDVQQAGASVTEVPSAPTDLDVGVQEAGLLAVTGGDTTTVASNKYDLLRVGTAPQATGTVIVDGNGSTLTTTGDQESTISLVGTSGDGVLLVANGGRFATEELSLGRDGGRGEMLVEGSGTEVAVEATGEPGYRGKMYVGDADGGDGFVTLSAGARVLAQDLVIGVDAGSAGRLTVEGDSTWLDLAPGEGESAEPPGGPFLAVGRYGEARMDIRDGAQVRVESDIGEAGFQVARREGAEGRLTVDGTGSRLSVDGLGQLGSGAGYGIVGRNGDGSLTVSNGGTVIVDDAGALSVAASATATGSLSVTGEGSVVDAGRLLAISAGLSGDGSRVPEDVAFTGFGTGTVTVADGGTVTAGEEAQDGIDDVFIGEGGTLNVQDGGTLIGDVRNEGGVFEPGNSPGRALVQGDFTSTGELRMEIDGTGEGAHDLIDVDGTADLAGTLQLDFSGATDLASGSQVTLLTANSGLEADDLAVKTVGLPEGFDADVVTTGTTMVMSLDGAG